MALSLFFVTRNRSHGVLINILVERHCVVCVCLHVQGFNQGRIHFFLGGGSFPLLSKGLKWLNKMSHFPFFISIFPSFHPFPLLFLKGGNFPVAPPPEYAPKFKGGRQFTSFFLFCFFNQSSCCFYRALWALSTE